MQRPTDGIRATQWTAYEVSLVTVPMDAGTTVTARSRVGGRRALPHELTRLARAVEAAGDHRTPAQLAALVREAQQFCLDPCAYYRMRRANGTLAIQPGGASYWLQQVRTLQRQRP